MSSPSAEPNEELDRVLQSARRLGVEMNEADALSWLTTMADTRADSGIVTDERTGVFVHKISMLDFSDADLEHFRALGRIVEFADVPGVVETALALSGSAAQSKFQTFPGDADFFERVNILAESRDAACKILADLIRAKTEQAWRGSTCLMIAVRFGSYPMDVVRGDKAKAKGSSTPTCPMGRTWSSAGKTAWSSRLVQVGLGDRGRGARARHQREQHARRHVGGA